MVLCFSMFNTCTCKYQEHFFFFFFYQTQMSKQRICLDFSILLEGAVCCRAMAMKHSSYVQDIYYTITSHLDQLVDSDQTSNRSPCTASTQILLVTERIDWYWTHADCWVSEMTEQSELLSCGKFSPGFSSNPAYGLSATTLNSQTILGWLKKIMKYPYDSRFITFILAIFFSLFFYSDGDII